MRSVSRFEFQLLRILRGILRRTPVEQVAQLVVTPHQRPGCLSRDCVSLVQDHLAKGAVSILARGGWHRDRFLRGAQGVTGRLWERTPPAELGLSFSRHTLSFLIWLTAADPRTRKLKAETENVALTLGDQFVFFLAYDAFRLTEAGLSFARQPLFNQHPLIRLAYPEDFTDFKTLPKLGELTPWVTGPGACLLESLEHWFVARWRALERDKATISRWQQMRGVGESQTEVLSAYLSALEQTKRFDLGAWLLRVLAELVQGTADARPWTLNLDVSGLRAADRMETYRAALALLHTTDRFEAWTTAARAVNFFDREEYAVSQLWLTQWDRWHGEQTCQQVRGIIRMLDPLRA